MAADTSTLSDPETLTLDAVLKGNSLARFGDGEFLIMDGKDARQQPYHPDLADELKQILADPLCMVSTPRVCGPNAKYWEEFMEGRPQSDWSSFISRPDEAPWIDRPDYWEKVRSLWEGRDVTLVGGGSIPNNLLRKAKSLYPIGVLVKDAWSEVDVYEKMIEENEIVLISAGATATVLADRLNRKGIWAVDIGSIGRWLRTSLE